MASLQCLFDGLGDGLVRCGEAEDVDRSGPDRVPELGGAPPVEGEDQAGLGQAQPEVADLLQAAIGHHARTGDQHVGPREVLQDTADGVEADAEDDLGPRPQTGDRPLDLVAELAGGVEHEDGRDVHRVA